MPESDVPHDAVRLRGVAVSAEQVLRAFHEFGFEAHDRDWLESKAQRYVVMHDGKPYPPKRILSIATGLPVRAFSGGREANGVLRALGFVVLPKAAVPTRTV
jgi:hypothetical protein